MEKQNKEINTKQLKTYKDSLFWATIALFLLVILTFSAAIGVYVYKEARRNTSSFSKIQK